MPNPKKAYSQDKPEPSPVPREKFNDRKDIEQQKAGADRKEQEEQKIRYSQEGQM